MKEILNKIIVGRLDEKKLWLSFFEVTTKDIGRAVCYIPTFTELPWELGTISSFNESYIFVNYGGNVKSTHRRNLVFEDDMYSLEEHVNMIKDEIYEERNALEDIEVLKATSKF